MAEPSNVFDIPGWYDATPEEQTLVANDHFNTIASNDQTYLNSDEAGKAEIRSAYQQLIEASALQNPNNPAIAKAQADQSKTDRQGFIANFKDKLFRSHEQAVDLAPMVKEALNPDGQLNPEFFARGAKYLQKQSAAPRTYADKELDADVTSRIKQFNHGGVSDKIKAAFGLVGDALTNPEGVMYLGADSAASITAMLLGAKAGALVGSGITAATGGTGAVAIPVATAFGTIAASTAHSGALEFMGLVQKDLDDNKIPYTEANIKAFYEANPDRIKQHQESALKYGVTMGTTDAAFGAVGGKIATLPEKAAVRSARATAMAPAGKAAIEEIVQKTGKSVDEITELYVNSQAKANLATQTFKSKLGHKVAGTGMEIISEPATEAAASIASGKEVTAKDLIMETLGGIGAGPYGAAVNTSIFGTKVAGDQTKTFAKKLLASTPESRAIAAEQKEEIKAAKVQKQSPADYAFEKDVAATDINDPKVNEWADPAHAAYDPVKAVSVLAKVEDPDTDLIDRARGIQNDFRAEIMKLGQQKIELSQKFNQLVDDGDSEAHNVQTQLNNLDKLIAHKTGTYQQVGAQVNKLKERANIIAQSREVKSIDPETATPDEVTEHITSSLGSGPSNPNIISNDGIATLLKRTDISDEQRGMLGALTAANIARKTINDRATSGKSIAEVSEDIYRGMDKSDFKGIDAYRQGIMQHLTANDEVKAAKQLEGLTKFRDAHQEKSELATELFDAYRNNGGKFTADQQNRYDAYRKLHPTFKINERSLNYVSNVAQEATALNAEVKLAESLIAVHKTKGQVVASPTPSSTSTANPAAPIVTPIPEIKPDSTLQDKAAKNAADREASQKRIDEAEEKGGDSSGQEKGRGQEVLNSEGAVESAPEVYAQARVPAKEKKIRKPQKNPRKKPKYDSKKDSLITAIARLGGIKLVDIQKLIGESAGKDLARELKNIVARETGYFQHPIKKDGKSFDDIRSRLVDDGYLQDEDSFNILQEMLKDSAGGSQYFSYENEGDIDAEYEAHQAAVLAELSQKEIDAASEIDLSEEGEVVHDDILSSVQDEDGDMSDMDYLLAFAEEGGMYDEDGNYPGDQEASDDSTTSGENQRGQKGKTVSSNTESESEINDSTDEEIADSLGANEYDAGLNELAAAHQKELQDLTEQINEANAILKCFGS